MSDGITVRCQAVAKSKLERLREESGNPNLTPDEAWPMAQCEHAAVPGKLVCGGRGGHGGGSMSVPTYSMVDFMPADMKAMMQEVIKNPQLLSRRFEIAQLISRIMVLYDRLNKNESLGGSFTLLTLQEAVRQIEDGEVKNGLVKLKEIVESRTIERETYNDIFTAMSLLKDMTKTEMGSIKEMKQIVTLDQMIALVSGIADTLTQALEKYVNDEHTRQLVSGDVARSIGRRINSGIGGVFQEADQQPIDGEYTEAE